MKICSRMHHVSSNPEETRLVGSELATDMPPGTVLSLVGDLGAGKTEFVKGLAIGFGIEGEVTSPTFTIVHEYKGGRVTLFHMDFYRLNEERELDEIGFDEYLGAGGICAIEWGEKFAHRLPPDAIRIFFSFCAGDQREIVW
jgi:tRNA threonylcarbamoyladenosine biosynthesis protein TsaE